MKGKHSALFLLLLAAAALLGWLLPVLAAEQADRSREGRTETVSVRQIDLSYQADLDAADRLNLIRERFSAAETLTLERGVCLSSGEALSILERFLQEFTGNSAVLHGRSCSLAPELLRFGSAGSVLVWHMTAELEGGWSCDVLLDDLAGLLLRCRFSAASPEWDSLVPGDRSSPGYRQSVCDALTRALKAHALRQLSADSDVELVSEELPLGIHGSFLLRQSGAEFARLPFLLTWTPGRIAVNN